MGSIITSDVKITETMNNSIIMLKTATRALYDIIFNKNLTKNTQQIFQGITQRIGRKNVPMEKHKNCRTNRILKRKSPDNQKKAESYIRKFSRSPPRRDVNETLEVFTDCRVSSTRYTVRVEECDFMKP